MPHAAAAQPAASNSASAADFDTDACAHAATVAAPGSSLASFLPASPWDNRPPPLRQESTPASRLASELPPLHSALLSSYPVPSVADSVGAIGMHSLPLDLLAYLLDFIPMRPRLQLLRRLCKRWNNAIVLSIRTRPDAFINLRLERRQAVAADLWPLLWRMRVSRNPEWLDTHAARHVCVSPSPVRVLGVS